ncbi:MAG: phosphatase PAP2 family protein [Proteobacteria bacterium]|nr:phosphatase PAP2 family protein [Pseudomonadota bacterium]
MANTDVDPHFRNDWQDNVRSKLTNNISDTINHYSTLTNYQIAIPFCILSMWVTSSFTQPNHGFGLWANHTFRTILVGSPEQLALSHLLGAGRPATGHPQWQLLKYHRAVSGHAFYGAIPLLNIAKQNDDPFIKFGLTTLSFLPGLARINDDKHYLSQVVLGWWLAACATKAVWESDKARSKQINTSIQLTPFEQGIYLGLKANF